MNRSFLQRAALCSALLLLSSCSTASRDTASEIFDFPVTVNAIDIDSIPLEGNQPSWDYPDTKHADGTITRLMWMAPSEAKHFKDFIILKHPIPAAKVVTVEVGASFYTQNRRDTGTGKVTEKALPVLEALMLHGPPIAVEEVTDLIVGIQKSIPQIDINIRVVEVLESDSFAFGVDTGWSSNETDPTQPSQTLLNSAMTILGLPDLPGRGASFTSGNSSVPLLVDLGTIDGGLRVDFLIRALKLFNKTDLLTSPHIAVLDGHAAEITAGEEIPFFTPQFNTAGISGVTTAFKSVGIKLFVTPKVIGRNVIRINLQTAVEAVTGQSTFQSANISVTNPILTVRKASTVMDVHDGDTAIIGGLITRSRLQAENRVPILGEIPILDMLFSSRSKQTVQSNLIFFITPKILDPNRDRRRLITPVMTPEPETDEEEKTETPEPRK